MIWILVLVYILGVLATFVCGIIIYIKDFGEVTLGDVMTLVLISPSSWLGLLALLLVTLSEKADNITIYDKRNKRQ